jgi:hypothetical protein
MQAGALEPLETFFLFRLYKMKYGMILAHISKMRKDASVEANVQHGRLF